MAKPCTRKSRNVTLRLPIPEIDLIEALAADAGVSRHSVIRNVLTTAIESGTVYDLVHTKTPV